jgi:hypothetical protein
MANTHVLFGEPTTHSPQKTLPLLVLRDALGLVVMKTVSRSVAVESGPFS